MKNAITWFDIPTLDFERALKFYRDILGSPLRVDDYLGQKLAYFPMDPKGDVGGDLVPPSKFNKPSKVGTRVYLSVESVDDVLARVVKAGGKIAQAKYSIGKPGYIAVIEDSEGNVVGLNSLK
jgi:predicted enzyme related to lactoylglutathione lyase